MNPNSDCCTGLPPIELSVLHDWRPNYLDVSTKTILTYLHRNPNFQRRVKEKNQMPDVKTGSQPTKIWLMCLETCLWRQWIFTDDKKWNLDRLDSPVWYWHDKRRDKLHKSRRQAGGGRTPIAFLEGNQDSQCYQRTLERSLLPYLDQIVDVDVACMVTSCVWKVSDCT